jgi:hypothetical protein
VEPIASEVLSLAAPRVADAVVYAPSAASLVFSTAYHHPQQQQQQQQQQRIR